MYDSDEVRDTVRREALAAEANPWQQALREYLEETANRPRNMLEQIAEAIMTWLQPCVEELLEIMRSFFIQIGEVVDAARRAMAELAEAIGLLERSEPEPFVWQQRSRRPQVQVTHSVDAVAAGRSPSAWFRTRIRGGRR